MKKTLNSLESFKMNANNQVSIKGGTGRSPYPPTLPSLPAAAGDVELPTLPTLPEMPELPDVVPA